MPKVKSAAEYDYVGVDGEGQGRDPHKYVLLMASNESSSRAFYVENQDGLSTRECLDFLISLPNKVRAFAFAFNYDLTKILVDIDDATLYRLFRPELRQRTGEDRFKGPYPVPWTPPEGGEPYLLNLQGTKFTVQRGKRRRVIWDVFKFFQAKFVSAIADWGVGTAESIQAMAGMKDKRGEFDKETPEAVRAYCLAECRYMAELARKLTKAHEDVGLKLTSYYGAGSSAAAMLKGMGILDKIRQPPEAMAEAVASGFFGGRFENSVVGPIEGTVYNYDISSAYPYQLWLLPCLEHGSWHHTTSARVMRKARHALVRYGYSKPIEGPWAPFPFREPDGNITFPAMSGGGWIWRDEYQAGERLFPEVYFKEAWVYECACDCRPFAKIPEYYTFRIKIGKEGKGIVIKLATNSCYGKIAQSIGSAPFQSWVWAGMITSGTRAQILDMMGLHKDRANLLMIATDGIFGRERFATVSPSKDAPPLTGAEPRAFDPVDTGTGGTGKPLGGWEEKVTDKGMFVARPGIYFPMNPTEEEVKAVRARGIGKAELLRNWRKLVRAWDTGEATAHVSKCVPVRGQPPCVQCAGDTSEPVTRFVGAKTSISRSKNAEGEAVYKRSKRYGEWLPRPIEMTFDPMPKRAKARKDGTLELRRMSVKVMSHPYDRSLSPEARMMQAATQEALEQPDGDDLTDYGETA